VTKRPLKDIGTSVRARLLRIAHERGEDFQLLLTRYANERLLFRLASSPHASRFVLKGAALFTVWTGHPHRATRDLDLLGFGEPGVAPVRATFEEILRFEVADDGVQVDPDSLRVGLIREEQEYGGVRVEVIDRMTAAQVRASGSLPKCSRLQKPTPTASGPDAFTSTPSIGICTSRTASPDRPPAVPKRTFLVSHDIFKTADGPCCSRPGGGPEREGLG